MLKEWDDCWKGKGKGREEEDWIDDANCTSYNR